MDIDKLLPKKIIRFTEEAEQDFQLNELNIREKTLECSMMKIKWLKKLFTEQSILKKLEELLESKRNYAIENGDVNLPKFQKALDVNKREDIVKLEENIKDQKEVIRFVDGVLRIANGFNFDLKNSIDYIKLSE